MMTKRYASIISVILSKCFCSLLLSHLFKTSGTSIDALEIPSNDNDNTDGGLYFNSNLTSIYFIGDLHGDVHCAKQWVEQTGLVDIKSTPFKWTGKEKSQEAIVFLGDYVDKGITSRGVLEFIRQLQETFPENIVPVLGNHDLYLMLDATLDREFAKTSHPMGQMAHDFSYSFMHPEEYVMAGWSPQREDDDEILTAMHDALQFVYENNLFSKVFLCSKHENSKDDNSSSSCRIDQTDVFDTIPPFRTDVELASRARQRIAQWREEYASGLIKSGLVQWLGKIPTIAVVGDSLVTHGGLSNYMMDYIKKVSRKEGIEIAETLHILTNVVFHKFWAEYLSENDNDGIEKSSRSNNDITTFPGDMTRSLSIISDLVTYRGYFKDESEVTSVISSLPNVNRIVVGHTPYDYADEWYGGKLLASDSSLSRNFRAYGNLYCPVKLRNNGKDISPMSGCADDQNDFCEGSISHLKRKTTEDEWPPHVKHLLAPQIDEDHTDEL